MTLRVGNYGESAPESRTSTIEGKAIGLRDPRLLRSPQILRNRDAPRVLLTSVFGPYAQDDEYGSRAINPMELYHNQVTREQGVFSLRTFHRLWGIMLIQQNISALWFAKMKSVA